MALAQRMSESLGRHPATTSRLTPWAESPGCPYRTGPGPHDEPGTEPHGSESLDSRAVSGPQRRCVAYHRRTRTWEMTMVAGMGPLRGTKGLGTIGEDDNSQTTNQQLRTYALAIVGIVVVAGAVAALVWLT